MAKTIGLSHISIHILELERTLKLYREILGFKLTNAVVFKSDACAEMLSLHMQLDSGFCIRLAYTSPQKWHTLATVGNTNHNHFTLIVEDILSIVEQLLNEGYEMEHGNYKDLKHNFFTGPNGEIIGLQEK